MNWIKLNAHVKLNSPFISRNYYAPLTSRVDTLEKANIILHSKPKVRFLLPTNHADKDSTAWRKQWDTPASKLQRHLKDKLRSGVLDGSIPSAASNTGASASAFKPTDPTIPTGIPSNTSFGGAFGDIAKATTINKLHHKIREPARSVHIVPQVKDSLLSTSKMVNADYIAVYDKDEVNFYDAKTTKIIITEEAVLSGFRCPKVFMASTTGCEPDKPQH